MPVLHTNDISHADIAVSMLRGEGIQAVERSWTPGGLFATSLEGATFPVTAAAVCVPRPFVEEAQEILSAMFDAADRHEVPQAPPALGPSAKASVPPAKLLALVCLLLAILALAHGLIGTLESLAR